MGDNFIEIRPFVLDRNSRMDQRDIQSIITVSGQFVDMDTDFLDWAQTLTVYGLIDEDKERDLRKKLTVFRGDKNARFIMFLGNVLEEVTFDDFVNVLYKQELSDFAQKLYQDRYWDTLARTGQADVPHAHFIQKYYCNMKQRVDNGVFKDSRRYLSELTETLKEKINQSEDADTKQFNAEKLVAVYILRLPQYSGYNARKAILDDMKSYFHDNEPVESDDEDGRGPRVDTNSADIVYASKMGITSAIAGDFNAARRFALEAECLGSLYRSSLARTLSYHDHQYVSVLEFKNTGDRKVLGQVLSIGDRGLRAMIDEHDGIRHQWNRLFMLYKILTLLGMRADFKMSKNYPSPAKVEQAKIVLKEMRGSFKNIEHRREMFYNLCMARAHEKSDIDIAIAYVHEAVRLSGLCTAFIPTERLNMNRYLRSLERRQKLSEMAALLRSLPLYCHAIFVLAFALMLGLIFR